MSDMEQFQIVVSEIQSIRQQMASLNAQIIELTATSDAVTNQPKDLALHQQLGGVLIEVADRKSLVKFSIMISKHYLNILHAYNLVKRTDELL